MTKQLLLICFLLFSCKSNRDENIQEKVTPPSESSVVFSDSTGRWTLGFSTPELSGSLCPLIIYLHGGIGTQRDDKGIDAYKMFTFLNPEANVLIASPSGNRKNPWWSRNGYARILESVSYMKSNFPVDTNQIILAGVSDGATGTFLIANFVNSPFTGYLGAAGFPPMVEKGMSIPTLRKKKIHMYVSGKDHLYPTSEVISFYDSLKTLGIPLSYSVIDSATHGFDYKMNEKETILSILNTWKQGAQHE